MSNGVLLFVQMKELLQPLHCVQREKVYSYDLCIQFLLFCIFLTGGRICVTRFGSQNRSDTC
jgi:hypothetical protein